jgi:Big-like domain-containing protein
VRHLTAVIALCCASFAIASAPASGQSSPTLVFYFAEGHIGDGFSELLNLGNFSNVDGSASVHYTFGDSGPLDSQVSVLAGTTRCIALGATGPENCGKESRIGTPKDISMKVTTPLGWAADRQMYFDTAAGFAGGHEQIGVPTPATIWYFAEGTTLPDFLEYLTIQNPDPTRDASVDIDYLTEGCSGNQSRSLVVPHETRSTVNVKTSLGVSCTGVASVVRSTNDVPIVAERPLYFVHDFQGNPAHPAADGHDVFGVNEPGTQWYFAEGTTLSDFKEYLALGNPGDTAAAVTVHYFTDASMAVDKPVQVPPHSRYTVEVFNVAKAGGLGSGITGVSVRVESSVPILAERPMYMVHSFPNAVNGAGFLVTGGHDAEGVPAPATRFLFVGATTLLNTADYLTIQNPDPALAAHLSIVYSGQSGQLGSSSLTVPAHTRSNVEIFNPARGGLAPDTVSPIGIQVASDAPVLIEQPSYFALNGLAGATDVAGFSPPPAPSGAPPPPPVISGTNPASPANNPNPHVFGTSQPGTTVSIYINASCSGGAVASGSATNGTFDIAASVAANTTTVFYANATDPFGNTSSCSGGVVYTEDERIPTVPALTGTNPASPSNNPSPHVLGTADPGDVVNLFTNATCTSPVAGAGHADGLGAFDIQATVALNATTTFHAWASDGVNTSSCSIGGISYVEDSTAPSPPSIQATVPTSPSNNASPQVKGQAEPGSTVRVYNTGACSGTPVSGTATGTGSFDIVVPAFADVTTNYRATATDAAGNVSGCSTSFPYVDDNTPPMFGGVVTATAGALTGTIVVSWAPGSDDFTTPSNLQYLVCKSITTTVCGSSFTVAQQVTGLTSTIVSGLTTSTTYFFVVRARDQAGNTDNNTVEVSQKAP